MDPRNPHEFANQHRQIFADQRLTPRDAQLRDSQAGGHPHETLNLFERENLAALHELHATFRHAVETPDITAVGNADPKIVVESPERIDQGPDVHHASLDREHPLDRHARAAH